MVDFRPLLFINALALMLLVTAGFASVRSSHDLADLPISPSPAEVVETVSVNTTEPATPPQPREPPEPMASTEQAPSEPLIAEPFSVAPIPENSPNMARAEPAGALMPDDHNDPAPAGVNEPAAKPEPEPTTGLLVLRSNVIGDQVTINGRQYGATRLDLELEPGTYHVAISKPGYQPWAQQINLDAGEQMTLLGKLEAYTTVNYRNGTWVGGVRTGDGTYQNKDDLRYEGHFIDGKFHGKGTAWYPDGSRYEGDWIEGQREGEGVWRGPSGAEYTGQFAADQFHGKGTLTRENGDIMTGQWAEGQLNGHGSLTTADGMLYVGGFRNNEFHGTGTLTYPDGRAYEGEFSNGAFHGTGAEIFADGKKYEGQYMEGEFHGKGLLRNPNGSSIKATFRHGEPYGQVRLTTAAGEVFTARTTEPGVCYREKSYRATQCPQLEGW